MSQMTQNRGPFRSRLRRRASWTIGSCDRRVIAHHSTPCHRECWSPANVPQMGVGHLWPRCVRVIRTFLFARCFLPLAMGILTAFVGCCGPASGRRVRPFSRSAAGSRPGLNGPVRVPGTIKSVPSSHGRDGQDMSESLSPRSTRTGPSLKASGSTSLPITRFTKQCRRARGPNSLGDSLVRAHGKDCSRSTRPMTPMACTDPRFFPVLARP